MRRRDAVTAAPLGAAALFAWCAIAAAEPRAGGIAIPVRSSEENRTSEMPTAARANGRNGPCASNSRRTPAAISIEPPDARPCWQITASLRSRKQPASPLPNVKLAMPSNQSRSASW